MVQKKKVFLLYCSERVSVWPNFNFFTGFFAVCVINMCLKVIIKC